MSEGVTVVHDLYPSMALLCWEVGQDIRHLGTALM